MADQLQLRGGTTAEHSTFTGALREVTVDTDKDTVVVHDGSTAGGHPLAKQNLSNVPAGTITSTMIADGTIVNADINASAAIDKTKISGTAITAGDTGTVTSTMIADGTIVNADVNASAAIAGTKISPDFGSQNVTTTGTSTAASFIPSSSTAPTNGVYLPSANNVAISTNGTGRLFVDADGNVGVGADAAKKLQVARGGGNATVSFGVGSEDSSGDTARNFVITKDAAGTDYAANIYFSNHATSNAGYLAIFSSQANERLRITSTGELKHIGGGSEGSPAVYFAGSAPSNSLYVQATTGRVGLGTSAPSEVLDLRSTGTTRIFFESNDGGSPEYRATVGVDSGGFKIQTRDGAFGNNTDRLTIDTSGRVGVGTTTVQAPLHIGTASAWMDIGASAGNRAKVGYDSNNLIFGSSSSVGQFIFKNNVTSTDHPNSSGAELVRIDSSGRVGIGTSSPSSTAGGLDISSGGIGLVVGADNNASTRTNSTDKVFRIGSAHYTNTEEPICIAFGQNFNADNELNFGGGSTAFNAATYIRFFTAANNTTTTGTERMRINSSGNVGIGTTSPTGPLQINMGTNKNIVFTGGLGEVGSVPAFQGINDAGSALTSIGMRGTDIRFACGSAERARIDSSGRLLVGTTISRGNFYNTSGQDPKVQIEGTSYITSAVSNVINSNDTFGARHVFGKSRGTTVGSNTIVQSGDECGVLTFQGSDGAEFVDACRITAQVDGTPAYAATALVNGQTYRIVTVGTTDFTLIGASANTVGTVFTATGPGTGTGTAILNAGNMPGRLVFSTTSDSASSPTERVRITSTGRLICGRDARDATLESTDQFSIEGNGYSAFHALNGTAYTIGQNSNSRALRIGSGSGWATTGVSLAAGGTSWGTYSDERLKTDIVELSDCLGSIKDIRCVSYRLTEVDEPDSKKRLGVIAQDLVGKYDEAINESRRSDDDETEYLSVQYTDLVPVLIKALQEASSKIEVLEARLTALESV